MMSQSRLAARDRMQGDQGFWTNLKAELEIGSLHETVDHLLHSQRSGLSQVVLVRAFLHGRPAGSALPLVWAHAEFVKLSRSLDEGAVFDTPHPVAVRYGPSCEPAGIRLCRFHHEIRSIPTHTRLRIETDRSAAVRWNSDDWKTVQEIHAQGGWCRLDFGHMTGSPPGAHLGAILLCVSREASAV